MLPNASRTDIPMSVYHVVDNIPRRAFRVVEQKAASPAGNGYYATTMKGGFMMEVSV